MYVKILGVIEEKTRTKMIVWKTLWKKKKWHKCEMGKQKKVSAQQIVMMRDELIMMAPRMNSYR